MENINLEFGHKVNRLSNEMIKNNEFERSFICPSCEGDANIIRNNDKGEDFFSVCECGIKAKLRIFL